MCNKVDCFVRHSFIPETKGRSLEEMDIIFGSITAEERRVHIEEFERGEWTSMVVGHLMYSYTGPLAQRNTEGLTRVR